MDAAVKRSLWRELDVLLILWVSAVALAGVAKFGIYAGVAVGGICIRGFGALTCYSAMPLSILVYAIFMYLVTRRRPESAIPGIMFAVPFGEFTYFLASMDPLRPFINWAYFDPWHFASWFVLMPVAVFLLHRQGISPRFTWVMVVWLIVDFAGAPFVPYLHTSLSSVIPSDLNIAFECYAVWSLFGGFSAPADSRPCAGGSSPSSARSLT